MAVFKVENPVTYQGLSSDSKPGKNDGDMFHVIDTGEVLVYHDGGWVSDRRLVFALKSASLLQ